MRSKQKLALALPGVLSGQEIKFPIFTLPNKRSTKRFIRIENRVRPLHFRTNVVLKTYPDRI